MSVPLWKRRFFFRGRGSRQRHFQCHCVRHWRISPFFSLLKCIRNSRKTYFQRYRLQWMKKSIALGIHTETIYGTLAVQVNVNNKAVKKKKKQIRNKVKDISNFVTRLQRESHWTPVFFFFILSFHLLVGFCIHPYNIWALYASCKHRGLPI